MRDALTRSSKQASSAPTSQTQPLPDLPRHPFTVGSTSLTDLSSLAPASLALTPDLSTPRTRPDTQKTADARHLKLQPSTFSSDSGSSATTLGDTDLASFQAFLDSLDSFPSTTPSSLVDYTQTAMTTDASMAAEFAELFDMGPMPLQMEDDGTNWESFLNFSATIGSAEDSFEAEAETTQHSPAPSTESEQSQQLDPSSRGTSPAADGVAYGDVSDPRAFSDPTMTSTFGAFGEFGDLSNLSSLGAGSGPMSLLGLNTDFALALPVQGPVETTALFADDKHPLAPIYSQLGWLDNLPVAASVPAGPAAPTTVSPSALTAISPLLTGLKRKVSDASDTSAADTTEPPKKRRGRPPKHLSRSTTSLLGTPASVSTLALNSPSASPSPTLPSAPLLRTYSSSLASALFGPASTSGAAAAAKGKKAPLPESTARPKSVVPVKYLKDKTAQTVTGMTQAQILSYTSYDELLKHVSADKYEGAKEFGQRLEEGRDKAADAAKRAREEKKARIYELEGEVDRLQSVLRRLVESGKVRMEDLEGA